MRIRPYYKGGSFASGLGVGVALGASRAVGAALAYILPFLILIGIAFLPIVLPIYGIYKLCDSNRKKKITYDEYWREREGKEPFYNKEELEVPLKRSCP